MEVEEDDPGLLSGKRFNQRFADAAGAAGDKDDMVTQAGIDGEVIRVSDKDGPLSVRLSAVICSDGVS